MLFGTLSILLILGLSVCTLLPYVMAETEWKIYQVSHEDQVFKIPYKITNGNVKTVEPDPDFPSAIVFLETDPDIGGTIQLTIPRNMLDSKVDTRDRNFIVLVDGVEPGYEEVSKSPCFRTLSIAIPAGTQEIEIISHLDPRSPFKGQTVVSPVHVSTEDTNYDVGETITITGCTSLGLDDNEVVLEVLNPEGKVYRTLPVIPNIDGTFSTSLVVEGEQALNGTYTARATYAGHSTITTFVVPEFPLSIIIFATAVSFIFATRLIPNLKIGSRKSN